MRIRTGRFGKLRSGESGYAKVVEVGDGQHALKRTVAIAPPATTVRRHLPRHSSRCPQRTQFPVDDGATAPVFELDRATDRRPHPHQMTRRPVNVQTVTPAAPLFGRTRLNACFRFSLVSAASSNADPVSPDSWRGPQTSSLTGTRAASSRYSRSPRWHGQNCAHAGRTTKKSRREAGLAATCERRVRAAAPSSRWYGAPRDPRALSRHR